MSAGRGLYAGHGPYGVRTRLYLKPYRSTAASVEVSLLGWQHRVRLWSHQRPKPTDSDEQVEVRAASRGGPGHMQNFNQHGEKQKCKDTDSVR